MLKIRFTFLVALFFSLSLGSMGQQPPADLQKYLSAEKDCLKSTDALDWEQAESNCGKALAESESLSQEFKREKMNALGNYAHILFNQNKFKEALINYTKALEIGKTFLAEDSFDLGYAYFNLGRSNQGVASIDGSYIVAAVENYLIAEKIFRNGLRSTADTETKSRIREKLRATLVLQQYIAVLRGQTKEAGEFRNAITELDKTGNSKN